jgi:putative GTP pyrophosphokinase
MAKLEANQSDNKATEYALARPFAERLERCVVEQIVTLLEQNDLTLAVPIEHRVKSASSVEEKIRRKPDFAESVVDFDDLVGLRLIMLFREDIDRAGRIIEENFKIIKKEVVGERLSESQFGYQSNHYIVSLKKGWLDIPSYKDLEGYKAEIQVRTLSQHMWAAASHKFQYKQEESVPPPLRRTIHRVSALLETVDLEFSRVLLERSSYIDQIDASEDPKILDVDVLSLVLSEVFPPENRSDGNEKYDELLNELRSYNVNSSDKLKSILEKHRDAQMKEDKYRVSECIRRNNFLGSGDPDRIKLHGVFFTHVGLARGALRAEFGHKPLTDPVSVIKRRRPSAKSS